MTMKKWSMITPLILLITLVKYPLLSNSQSTRVFRVSTPASTSGFGNPAAGYCSQYSGIACKNIKALRNVTTLVWTDYNYSHLELDNVINSIFRDIENDKDGFPLKNGCLEISKEVICTIVFPPCDNEHICRQGCKVALELCPIEWGRLAIHAYSNTYGKGIIPTHTYIPRNCSYFSTKQPCQLLFNEISAETLPVWTIVIIVIAVVGSFITAGYAMLRYYSSNKIRSSSRDNEMTMVRNLPGVAAENDSKEISYKHNAPSRELTIDTSSLHDVTFFQNNQIQVKEKLGEGHFSTVYKGFLLDNDKETPVALKLLKASESDAQKQKFIDEASANAMFNHENIVKLIGVSFTSDPYYLILEYMQNGNLHDYLANNAAPIQTEHRVAIGKRLQNNDYINMEGVEYLEHSDLIRFLVQAASALNYLSNLRVIHRDIAARNCLLGENKHLKISDFGLCKDIYADQHYKMQKMKNVPLRWSPPEVLLRSLYTEESDVYSFGVLMWEVFSFAISPFYQYTFDEVTAIIKSGQTKEALSRPATCISNEIWKLMTECWEFYPKDRPSASEILTKLHSEEDQSVYDNLNPAMEYIECSPVNQEYTLQ